MRFIGRFLILFLIIIILGSFALYNKRSTHCYEIESNYPTINYTHIPKTIFMSDKTIYKVYSEVFNSWRNKNQDYELRFFNDFQADEYVKKNMPEIYPTYNSLTIPVLKADLFRYVALYVNGGIYSDTDTLCIKPISSWSDGEDSDAIIAVERYGQDLDIACKGPLARDIQFIQWTLASKPKHPIFKSIIEKIQNITPIMLKKANITNCDILNWTGPEIFSDAVMEFFNLEDKSVLDIGKGITIKNVRVLPRLGFTAYDNKFHPEGKVQHMFWGSWKKHDNFLTKIYQSIERKLYVNIRCV